MASSIMGDTAITALRQKEHLILECIRAQRPAVAEDNRLSLAPVVVIDLRSIFCRDRTHTFSSYFSPIYTIGFPKTVPQLSSLRLPQQLPVRLV